MSSLLNVMNFLWIFKSNQFTVFDLRRVLDEKLSNYQSQRAPITSDPNIFKRYLLWYFCLDQDVDGHIPETIKYIDFVSRK